jgi:hypothetical protein
MSGQASYTPEEHAAAVSVARNGYGWVEHVWDAMLMVSLSDCSGPR